MGAIADVALAGGGPALGDLAAGLVVGDHAFGHPGSLGWLEIGHGVELDGELGSELLELKVDRWPIPEQDPQPDRSGQVHVQPVTLCHTVCCPAE